MINFVSDPNEPKWHGILIVLGFIVTSFLDCCLSSFYNVQVFRTALNLRSSLVNLIYIKALKISPSAKKNRTQGELTNLISIDANKFSDFAPFFAYIWSAPLQIFIGFYLLYRQLGYAVFVGAIVIVLMMLFHYYLSNFRNKFFSGEMKLKDQRVKLINEILTGMKVIKFYGWEKAFQKKITAERQKEINFLIKSSILGMLNWFIYSISPIVVKIALEY